MLPIIDLVAATVPGGVYWCFLLSPLVVVIIIFIIFFFIIIFFPFPNSLWILSLKIVNVQTVKKSYYLYFF